MKRITLFFVWLWWGVVGMAQEAVTSSVSAPDFTIEKGSHSLWFSSLYFTQHWNYIPIADTWDKSYFMILGVGARYEYAYHKNRTLGVETNVGLSGDFAMDYWGPHRHSSFWQLSLLHTFHFHRFQVGIGPSMEWTHWWYIFDGGETDKEDYIGQSGYYGIDNFSLVHYAIGPTVQLSFAVIPSVTMGIEYTPRWMWHGAFRGKWERSLALNVRIRCGNWKKK